MGIPNTQSSPSAALCFPRSTMPYVLLPTLQILFTTVSKIQHGLKSDCTDLNLRPFLKCDISKSPFPQLEQLMELCD